MATLREIVYMVIDKLKLFSDDSTFTEEHIIFLAMKLRGILIEQKYATDSSNISDENYQTICVDIGVDKPDVFGCTNGTILRSANKIPDLLSIAPCKIFSTHIITNENFVIVSMENLPFTGYNNRTRNFIYVALGEDGYLYLKSANPNLKYLKTIHLSGIFSDAAEAWEHECDCSDSEVCDILDREFPLESILIPPLISMILSDLQPSVYLPKDNSNNAVDDLSQNKVVPDEQQPKTN